MAQKPVGPLDILPVLLAHLLEGAPRYSTEEYKLANKLGTRPVASGWEILPDQRVLLPEPLGKTVVSQIHQSTHLGSTQLAELLSRDYHIPRLHALSKSVISRCQTCKP